MENHVHSRLLQIISLSLTIIGILGSLVMMAHTGHNNRSVFLILTFAGWVSSPFLALLIAYFSDWWPDTFRKSLYILMIAISLISLIIYSGAFGIHGPHPAFVFMVVPLISWLLIVIIWVASIKVKK